MKKRIIALIVVLALVISLAACSKAKKPAGNDEKTETEAETEDEDSSQESDADALAFFSDYKDMEEDNPDSEMQKAFAEFVDYQYKTAMETSYTNIHIYYKDPVKAGFNMDNVDIVISEVPTPENNKEDREYYSELRKTFDTFERSKLTKEQQDEYDCLVWELAIIEKLLDEKFDYYTQLFAPPNSLEANLISFLSAYELRSEREVQEVVELINSIPGYVDESISYAKVQQEKELLMTDFDAVIKGCDDALATGMDSSVMKKLLEHVDNLDEITPENKEKYKKEITEALEKSYLPSFQKIKDAMESMKGGYNNEEGYATFPHGKEFFEVLLNYSLGTIDLSSEDLDKYVEERSAIRSDELFSAMMDSMGDSAVLDFINGNPITTEYSDYHVILEEVKEKMLTDHPEVKSLEYNVEQADPEEKLTEKNIAAYFIIPPVDGDHKQQMRVDPNTENVSSIDSYMTITHEGFPGHMYQYAYLYETIASDYIKTLGVDGNVEGYAMYAQYNALDYLEGFSDSLKSIVAKNSMFSYLLYTTLDIGINYHGWNYDSTKKYLDEAGFALEDEEAKEIYDFLRCSPGAYEPYGCGFELIAELRDNAEKALGDKFDAKAFNKALLDAGPSPYEVVKRHIAEYVFENL